MGEPVLVDEVACGMGKSQPDLTKVEPRGGSELLLEFETGTGVFSTLPRLSTAADRTDAWRKSGTSRRCASSTGAWPLDGLKARKCTPRPCTSSARLSGSGAGRARFSPAAPGARRTRSATQRPLRRSAGCSRPPFPMAPRFGILAGMSDNVTILGAGLAGSEAALQLADRGFRVRLVEMRPRHAHARARHRCVRRARVLELVEVDQARERGRHAQGRARGAGIASAGRRATGTPCPPGARWPWTARRSPRDVTARIEGAPAGRPRARRGRRAWPRRPRGADALVVATGPLASGALAADLARVAGAGHLAFYDAAAPIVMADSLDGGAPVPAEPLRGRVRRGGRLPERALHARGVRGLRRRACGRRARRAARLRDARAVPGLPAHRGDRAQGPRRPALRPPQARGPHRPAHGKAPLGRAPAARRGRARLVLQPGGLPDEPDVPRAASRVPPDPRLGAGGVRPLRRDAPQHVPRRSAPARRQPAPHGSRGRRAGRARVRGGPARGHRGVLRGAALGPACRARRGSRALGVRPAAAAARDGLRRASGLRHEPRDEGLPADARELRHHGAAGGARAQQARPLCRLRRARRRGARGLPRPPGRARPHAGRAATCADAPAAGPSQGASRA